MAMFDVSVIIASVESARSIGRCVESVRAALEGKCSEVIVVDASRDTSADIAERGFGHAVVVIRCAPGTLTPELWAIGIRRSTGRVIALTTGHFEVGRAWLENLESALRAGHTGAAGRLDLADATSVTDWAVFYLRYSEFLQEPEKVWRGVPGIPADNAAYDGEAIRRFVMNSDDGFWEVEFHRQLHAAGGSLAVVPGATARYARSFPFPTIARHRFHHGRHAGAWRASRAGRSAAMIVAGTPLVPFALALRAWRRVRPMVEHRGRFLRALPAFLVLAGCWAVGEAVGAIGGAPAPSGPVPRPA
ncbi:MAG TPA: glycosyltransferase [Gemmatimonadaceae bacterium]|jgi:glycosyltransferase involved in cell wall biosynthesis|nr:glycosyltransferase [Gemmatimonadaceae bacterium]